MAHTFRVHGEMTAKPSSGSPSGCVSFSAPIDESISLSKEPATAEYDLTADAPQAVAFGALSQANVIMIKTVGGKVAATLTSADGAAQVIPVDSFALIMSTTVPYTALSITRAAGVATTVKILLGERT